MHGTTYIDDVLVASRLADALPLAEGIYFLQQPARRGRAREGLPAECDVHHRRIDTRLAELARLADLLHLRPVRFEDRNRALQLVCVGHEEVAVRVFPARR